MNKKHFSLFSIVLLFLAGCAAPQTEEVDVPATLLPTEIVEDVVVSPLPQELLPLRYAILAPTSSVNIWALFDKEGASYENYAVQGEYYPRLYHLLPPNNEFVPLLAKGFPSPIIQDGNLFSSTVILRPNLKWDDNSPLTAEDVAFTVNTALAFDLGLSWADFYNKEKLHHVEALDKQTIKYYFFSPPSVGDWQQGALIGVFSSQKFWALNISEAIELLPPAEKNPRVEEYRAELKTLQDAEPDIRNHLQDLKEKSAYYHGQELILEQNLVQQEVFENKLEIIQRENREKFSLARAMLYALDDTKEPRAGLWQLSTQEENFTENVSNIGSHFEFAQYKVYERDDALRALHKNKVDFVLARGGLSDDEIAKLSDIPEIQLIENRRNDIRFLAFNHQRNPLDDVALRRALSCLIDLDFLAEERLDERVVTAFGWIHPENTGWHSSSIEPPCAGMDADARFAAGTLILKKAGYVWGQEPSPNHAGSGLKLPSGALFPSISVLASSSDLARANAASYIAYGARQLGIPLTEEIISADDFLFTVYGIKDYDLAIVGWSLSTYPDYLCDLFSTGNPYSYDNPAINIKCAELSINSDIALARQQFFDMEILLWDDLPAIPLFSSKITEAYRNISLPFDNVLGGIAPTFYGAPTLFEQER